MLHPKSILDELLTRQHRSFLSQQIIFSYQLLVDLLYKVWGGDTYKFGRAMQIAADRAGDLSSSGQLFEGIFIDQPIDTEKLEQLLKTVKIIKSIPGGQNWPAPIFGRTNALVSSINFFAVKNHEHFILDRIGITKQKLLEVTRCMWEIRACAFVLRSVRNDDEHEDIQNFSIAHAIAATGCASRLSECLQKFAGSLQGYAPSFLDVLVVPNCDCSQSLNKIIDRLLNVHSPSAGKSVAPSNNNQDMPIEKLNSPLEGVQGGLAEILPILLKLQQEVNESQQKLFGIQESLESIEGQSARIEHFFIHHSSTKDFKVVDHYLPGSPPQGRITPLQTHHIQQPGALMDQNNGLLLRYGQS